LLRRWSAPLDPQIEGYDFGLRKGAEMTVSKHSEAQIIGALKQIEAGRTAADVAREHGVSKHTIYAWKAR
jgi:transposase-like protein